MKKVFIALAAIAGLGMLAPEVQAQAPAPKVTINGLVDFVATAYKNWTSLDATDGGKDQGFYSRERGVFTITGEVGKTKGVWAIELDFSNGAGQATSASGGSSARDNVSGMAGVSSPMDLDTDVSGALETKWLYLETPVTGPGSLMPFIPVPTIARLGAQPSRGHEYKPGILLGGDMPGATFETTWAPNLRSTLTFVQIMESIDRVANPTSLESFAILASAEVDVFKGLTVKPTYAYGSWDGGNCGSSNFGTHIKNGFNPNVCGTAASPTAFGTLSTVASGLRLTRHTIGGDVRWTSGPFTITPTFLYQFGEQEIRPLVVNGRRRDEVDIHSWILDVIGSFRTGPLLLETRFLWTPGMAAQHQVQNGSDIAYYQPIHSGGQYMGGGHWTEIQASGIDYATVFLGGVGGIRFARSPAFDKYGRIFLAQTADYSITPTLTLEGIVNFSWTDEAVDTSGVLSANGLTSPRLRGTRDEESYIGTEIVAGFTYRFAPNVAFVLHGAYLFAGAALSHARVAAGGGCRDRESSGSPACSADDVYKIVSRIRLTF